MYKAEIIEINEIDKIIKKKFFLTGNRIKFNK